MKAAFAARFNLVTYVTEVAKFPCWLRKSRTMTEAHKIKLLGCSTSKGTCTSQHDLNKVLRDSSCVYFLFF